jgi:hypothetical protein
VEHWLVKAAYTGVAAALIGGKTTHTIAGLSSRAGNKISEESKRKLQSFWGDKKYLIIDEFSMISKTFLARLSRNISIGKQGGADFMDAVSFGGLNVVLCGDLHQFPPVAVRKCDHLYRPLDASLDTLDAQLGRGIYEEFQSVVILTEQMRVTDLRWRELLSNIRRCRVQKNDLEILHALVLDESNIPEFQTDPWRSAPLITPRHAVRILWNEFSARRWCQTTNRHLFICPCEDTIAGRPLNMSEQYHVALQSQRRTHSHTQLPDQIEITNGMQVLVTNNISTDLDITNGARGEIVDIMLHPEETADSEDTVVCLQHLPVCVLVKLEQTRATAFPGLQANVIPIFAMKRSFQIQVPTPNGSKARRNVTRRQFPITPAYAFTDYRSQGQTLSRVIVDLATPPSGSISLFNIYVALSRSAGQSTIRLLRDFDDTIFTNQFEPELMREDERLERLEREQLVQPENSW